jgi:hypothetical protein
VDANTVIAGCATVIAVASLSVTVYEARAMRRHNRYSVRPILELDTSFRVGDTAGLRLSNSGLGPAAVTTSSLTFDNVLLGEFNEANVNKVRDALSIRPSAVTLGGKPFLDMDYDRFLLSVRSYDKAKHREFYELIRCRLRIEIQYDSMRLIHGHDHRGHAAGNQPVRA